MLIVPKLLSDGSLILIAYTYDDNEVSALKRTLEAIQISAGYKYHRPTSAEVRPSYEFRLSPKQASKLGQALNLSFVPKDRSTVTIIHEGRGYRCKEITVSGEGRGCTEMTANNPNEAIVKCALIAQVKGWFGGVAAPGDCDRRSILGRLFRK